MSRIKSFQVLKTLLKTSKPEVSIGLKSKLNDFKARLDNIKEQKEILESLAEDKAEKKLLQNESQLLNIQEATLETEFNEFLPTVFDSFEKSDFSKSDFSKDAAIVELRAGTGGKEAALFAKEIFNMYETFCSIKKWKFEVLSMNQTDLDGIKSSVFEVSKRYPCSFNLYERFLLEQGVHRVKRVPVTESQGRIHTSGVFVTTTPKITEKKFEVADKDLKFEAMRSSGAGGQNVQKNDSAVRVTHIPTGLTCRIEESRYQYDNKAKAILVITSRVVQFLKEQEEKAQAASLSEVTRWFKYHADRPVRSFHFGHNYVTDHRIGVTVNNKVEEILSGESLDDEFSDKLLNFLFDLKLKGLMTRLEEDK